MSRRLLNLALIVLLVPFLVSFAHRGVLFLLDVFTLEATKWFLVGAGLFLLGYVLLLNGRIDFIEDLLHELEHAAVDFFFSFQLPGRMEVDPDPEEDSNVDVTGRGGCLTALGPYYFPLLALPFLLLKGGAALALSLLDASFPTLLAVALDLLIGATLTFQYVCSIKEFGEFQEDVRTVGWIPSFAIVVFLNLMFLILSVTVVTGSYAALWAYVKIAGGGTVDAYKAAYEHIETRLLPALADLIQSIKDMFCETCTPTPAP